MTLALLYILCKADQRQWSVISQCAWELFSEQERKMEELGDDQRGVGSVTDLPSASLGLGFESRQDRATLSAAVYRSELWVFRFVYPSHSGGDETAPRSIIAIAHKTSSGAESLSLTQFAPDTLRRTE